MVWATVLLIGVLIASLVLIIYVRSIFREDRSNAVDMEKMTRYLKEAKVEEQEAWTNMLTVMEGDKDDLNTVLGDYAGGGDASFASSMPQRDVTGKPAFSPNFLQMAFFNFWKIPASSIPKTREDANQFIEAYKEKLKEDGYVHRVRRWNRMELLMGRFSAEYDLEKLNKKCYEVGANKQMLDIVIEQVMGLLGKKKIEWKTVSGVPTYNIVIESIAHNYPQLNLSKYKRR